MPDTTSSGAVTLGAQTPAGVAAFATSGSGAVTLHADAAAGTLRRVFDGTGFILTGRLILRCVGRGAIHLQPMMSRAPRNPHLMRKLFSGLSYANRQRRFRSIGK